MIRNLRGRKVGEERERHFLVWLMCFVDGRNGDTKVLAKAMKVTSGVNRKEMDSNKTFCKTCSMRGEDEFSGIVMPSSVLKCKERLQNCTHEKMLSHAKLSMPCCLRRASRAAAADLPKLEAPSSKWILSAGDEGLWSRAIKMWLSPSETKRDTQRHDFLCQVGP